MQQTIPKTIPDEIKELQQWVVWRYEERDGKTTKVPYNPKDSKRAKSNDPATWGTLAETQEALGTGDYDGLGIQLANNLCAIDLDHVIDEAGEFTDNTAQEIINTMDSYTEYSPSKTGAHILFFGEPHTDLNEYYAHNEKLEMYSSGRYLTFTGEAITPGKAIEERTEQAKLIQDKHMKKAKPATQKSVKKTEVINLDDATLIDKAMKARDGEKFSTLWNGDFSGYGSQSEADQALCNKLSFWANKDFDRIDSLFKQSGLYRTKWDRADYKTNTINNAIAATTDVYNPTQRQEQNEAIPEEKQDDKFFLVPKNQSKPENGLKVNVSLLAMYIKNKYDIKRYKNQFKVFKNNYYANIEDIKCFIGNEIPNEYRLPNNIRDCEDLLLYDAEIILNDRDLAGEEYIAFKNGVLNVKTMEFAAYGEGKTSNLKFINQVDYCWNQEAPADKLTDDFFENITNGKQEEIDYLYQLLGVAMSGYRDFKNILYFTGEKDTGKSQYLRLIEKLLTNADGLTDFSSIGLRTLTDENSKEFTRIIGKRANICGETPAINITNDVLLKQLSGGDTVSAHVKFQESFDFVNRAILIFAGNTVPNFFVSDKSSISERMLVYSFKNAIPKNKQIKSIYLKLKMEYIIQKAVTQLRAFIDNNQEFKVPQEIFTNRETMVKESDTIYKFFKEQVTVTPNAKDRISCEELYKAYLWFMVNEGHLQTSWDNQPNTQGFKVTRYIFTKRINELIGKNYCKRNISFAGIKTDGYVNLKMITTEE